MRTLLFSTIFVLVVGLFSGWAMSEGTVKAKVSGFGLIGLGRLRVGLWAYRPNRVYYRLEMS